MYMSFVHFVDFSILGSDKGIVYSARAYKIPECTRAAAGVTLVQVSECTSEEKFLLIMFHIC